MEYGSSNSPYPPRTDKESLSRNQSFNGSNHPSFLRGKSLRHHKKVKEFYYLKIFSIPTLQPDGRHQLRRKSSLPDSSELEITRQFITRKTKVINKGDTFLKVKDHASSQDSGHDSDTIYGKDHSFIPVDNRYFLNFDRM